jgi:hypothetical protein
MRHIDLNVPGICFCYMEVTYLLLVLTSIVATLFIVLYVYLSYVYMYCKRRGLPFLEPNFPAGNIKNIVLSLKALAEVYFDFYQNSRAVTSMDYIIFTD